MRDYVKVLPEVIVGLGKDTTFSDAQNNEIKHLHIELEDWLGDDLMTCYPTFLVTEELRLYFEKQGLSNLIFQDIELTFGDYFQNNYDLPKEVPTFYWLYSSPKESNSTLFIEGKELFVETSFLEFLKNNFNINFLAVNPERNEFDDFLDQLISEP